MSWLATSAVTTVSLVSLYFGYALGDRSKPYTREFGVASALNPAECGLPSGPVPDVIRVGDCVGPLWTITRHKVCDVTEGNKFVTRWLIDENRNIEHLSPVLSQFTGGAMANNPLLRKTFIQPPIHPGWVSYGSEVCFECPVKAYLLNGMRNPLHQIAPVCVNDNSIEYRVEP